MTDAADAYQRLDEAIHQAARFEGAEGVLLEWIVVAAHQSYDDGGDPRTQIVQLVPGGGDAVPYHRLLGLLDYATTLRRHEITDL